MIGKHSSMLNILKAATKCEILVGKNGLIWIKGPNQQKAVEAIDKIDREAHLPGLTDRIIDFLGVKPEDVAAMSQPQRSSYETKRDEGQREERGGYGGRDRGFGGRDRGGFRGRNDREPRRDYNDRRPRQNETPREAPTGGQEQPVEGAQSAEQTQPEQGSGQSY